MRYLTGTRAELDDIRAALAQAEGLPRRGTVVGGPDMLPSAYAPGAPGFTDHVVGPPIESDDRTVAMLELPDGGLQEAHLGKRVRVGGRDVDIPGASARRDEAQLPQKLRDVLERRRQAARGDVALPGRTP